MEVKLFDVKQSDLLMCQFYFTAVAVYCDITSQNNVRRV